MWMIKISVTNTMLKKFHADPKQYITIIYVMASDILNNRAITIIISIIWGLGLALLFRKTCQNENCVVVKVPPEFYLRHNIIKSGNHCYQLQKYASTCNY